MNTQTNIQTNTQTNTQTAQQSHAASNFEKVVEFNTVFGLPTHTSPQTDIVRTNPALTTLRVDLITEECQELVDAVKANDFTEIVDALADILYVVYGAGSSFGVDLNKAFDIVHSSNMSKLCRSEAEARLTVEWYRREKLDVYDSPDYRKSECGKYWIVFNRSSGKILKSINYTPAKFDMSTLGL